VRISRTTTAIPAMRARWIGGLEHVGLGREGLEETDRLLGEVMTLPRWEHVLDLCR